MASQKQIEANRLNASKSTGPRSAEGKAVSRMNALQSGIDAQSQVILTENAADLERLKNDYYDRFHPATPEQCMLVDTLIDSEWLLRRFRVVEAQLWTYVSDSASENDGMELGQAFCRSSKSQMHLQRRVDATHRNYRNALHELQRLQAEEAALQPDPEPEPVPQPAPNQSPSRPNGFVPQLVSPEAGDTSGLPLDAAKSLEREPLRTT